MSRLHPVRAHEVIHFLESLGFVQVRQRGSHRFFRHPDGPTATVPDHKGEDLGRGILAKILRDAGVKPAEFLAWLSFDPGDHPGGDTLVPIPKPGS